MLLAVHLVCYSELDKIQCFGFKFKHMLKLVKMMGDGPFMIGDIEVTDELLEKVEAYIQEEIEMMHKPTVLH